MCAPEYTGEVITDYIYLLHDNCSLCHGVFNNQWEKNDQFVTYAGKYCLVCLMLNKVEGPILSYVLQSSCFDAIYFNWHPNDEHVVCCVKKTMGYV